MVSSVNFQSTEAEDVGKAPATILIVDDEPLTLRAIVRVLQSQDYNLLSADTPVRALELAEVAEDSPKLLITDINMPGMDGFVLAARLRERFDKLAVLYVCGYPIESLNIPPSDHGLAKPFTHDELLAAVHQALGD